MKIISFLLVILISLTGITQAQTLPVYSNNNSVSEAVHLPPNLLSRIKASVGSGVDFKHPELALKDKDLFNAVMYEISVYHSELSPENLQALFPGLRALYTKNAKRWFEEQEWDAYIYQLRASFLSSRQQKGEQGITVIGVVLAIFSISIVITLVHFLLYEKIVIAYEANPVVIFGLFLAAATSSLFFAIFKFYNQMLDLVLFRNGVYDSKRKTLRIKRDFLYGKTLVLASEVNYYKKMMIYFPIGLLPFVVVNPLFFLIPFFIIRGVGRVLLGNSMQNLAESIEEFYLSADRMVSKYVDSEDVDNKELQFDRKVSAVEVDIAGNLLFHYNSPDQLSDLFGVLYLIPSIFGYFTNNANGGNSSGGKRVFNKRAKETATSNVRPHNYKFNFIAVVKAMFDGFADILFTVGPLAYAIKSVDNGVIGRPGLVAPSGSPNSADPDSTHKVVNNNEFKSIFEEYLYSNDVKLFYRKIYMNYPVDRLIDNLRVYYKSQTYGNQWVLHVYLSAVYDQYIKNETGVNEEKQRAFRSLLLEFEAKKAKIQVNPVLKSGVSRSVSGNRKKNMHEYGKADGEKGQRLNIRSSLAKVDLSSHTEAEILSLQAKAKDTFNEAIRIIASLSVLESMMLKLEQAQPDLELKETALYKDNRFYYSPILVGKPRALASELIHEYMHFLLKDKELTEADEEVVAGAIQARFVFISAIHENGNDRAAIIDSVKEVMSFYHKEAAVDLELAHILSISAKLGDGPVERLIESVKAIVDLDDRGGYSQSQQMLSEIVLQNENNIFGSDYSESLRDYLDYVTNDIADIVVKSISATERSVIILDNPELNENDVKKMRDFSFGAKLYVLKEGSLYEWTPLLRGEKALLLQTETDLYGAVNHVRGALTDSSISVVSGNEANLKQPFPDGTYRFSISELKKMSEKRGAQDFSQIEKYLLPTLLACLRPEVYKKESGFGRLFLRQGNIYRINADLVDNYNFTLRDALQVFAVGICEKIKDSFRKRSFKKSA